MGGGNTKLSFCWKGEGQKATVFYLFGIKPTKEKNSEDVGTDSYKEAFYLLF